VLVLARGAVAGAAALSRPGASWPAVLPAAVGTGAGLVALVRTGRLMRDSSRVEDVTAGRTPDRRRVLVAVAATAGAAVLAGAAARLTAARARPRRGPADVSLPPADEPAPALPAGVSVDVPGVPPFLTPAADFYRIDTALVVPALDAADHRIRVHGQVDRPFELTYDELLAMPLVERVITLTCVSNEVGGTLAGTARWTGVRVRDLLERAGSRPDADMVLSRSSDGFTASTPLATLLDGRDALLAVGMNGAALPFEHGFPVRLIVPGLYGYVSATKWLTELEVTRFDRATAYWTRRGWAPRAPIRTFSRIDVPRAFARVQAGPTAVAGVAWAQHRGVARVEVRVDGGSWQAARLADAPSTDTWRQWVWSWDATPGPHRLEVRATDALGATQPETRRPPKPDGATGWQSVAVTVA
jgi:DMSO/TMAO reductase YedYZ molybdopterin-dependent catalytic subunit